MNLEIDMSISNLATALSRADQHEVIDLIIQTDDMIAEVEFTERLLMLLVTSLKRDLDTTEKANLMSKLIDTLA